MNKLSLWFHKLMLKLPRPLFRVYYYLYYDLYFPTFHRKRAVSQTEALEEVLAELNCVDPETQLKMGSTVSFFDDRTQENRTGVLMAIRRSTRPPWRVAMVRLRDGQEIEVRPDRLTAVGEGQHAVGNSKTEERSDG